MASILKADTVQTQSGSGTLSVGASGDTVNIAGTAGTGFPSSGFTRLHIPSAGTYTVLAGITKIVVEVQGAGGSGSRGTTGAKSMGGAGGGYAKKYLDVTVGDTMTVSIGTGGTSREASEGVGVAGGFSKFEPLSMTTPFSPDVVGNGGAGGNNSGFGASYTAVGGTGTGGDISIQGGNGQPAAVGYFAGGSFLGIAGKNQDATTATEAAGLGYGAGGGGGHNQNSGVGAPGVVIIWEYK